MAEREMRQFFVLLTVLCVAFISITSTEAVDFQLGPNETVIKEIQLDRDSDISRFLTLQTSSPISLKVSGGNEGCPEEMLLEESGSVEIEVAEDTWNSAVNCGTSNEGVKKIRFHIFSKHGAFGSITIQKSQAALQLRAEATVTHGVPNVEKDLNRFTVSENTPFFQKVKLESLLDKVQIQLTSENVENALEVFISFCPTNKGILYTTSYAPNLDITLKSPRMELYYDAYSCDSNITFYSNTSQPVSPLIIRLESQFTINGTITVLVNGAEPSLESQVGEYETGDYALNGGEMKTIEVKYQPTMENVKVYLELGSGHLSAYLSPCRNIPLDSFYSDFTAGSHQIDINVEDLMANTTCALMDIDPTTVFLTLKSSTTSVFNLWIPGEKTTWYLAIGIALVLILLALIMAVIIYFGRRKTGKLVINYFQ